MPVARSFKRGYLSSVPPALHSVLHAAFIRCCGLYRYICVRVCVHVFVTRPWARHKPCILVWFITEYGTSRSFLRPQERVFFRFFPFTVRRSIYGHSLKVYVRQKTNVSSPKCTDIASSVHCAYRHVAHVSRQVQLRLLRVAAFAVPSGNSSSLVVEWRE